MVESGCNKEYILQWPGHAAYVTERFSGLLARQALVDVTLICEEQKLRVHKLVLAVCSPYFEEMLADDIGHEPTILLRDLKFSVLKAMIEFMYCGETTVSHVYLPALLAAARLFKVKELESLVEKMVGLQTSGQDHNENNQQFVSKENQHLTPLENGSDDNGIRVFANENDSTCKSLFHSLDTSNSDYEEEDKNETSDQKSTESYSDSSTLDLDNAESKPEIYEKYCDHVNSRKDISNFTIQNETTEEEEENCIPVVDIEVSNKVGQCSRKYTRKKHKNKIKDKTNDQTLTDLNNKISQVSDTVIDLIQESSSDEIPVTLQTNLDGESSNYSFSSLEIQSIVGCSLTDFRPVPSSFELLEFLDEEDQDDRPILRRSMRINQQEVGEENVKANKSKLSEVKRKKKRKSKELERRVPNIRVLFGKKNHTKSIKKSNRNNDKRNNGQKSSNKFNISENYNIDYCTKPSKSASVNRALWGDMTDIAEDGEVDEEFLEYSTCTEIPFAVGLLPLRAALERMQATLDHQPRKTRSSNASSSRLRTLVNAEINYLKRKNPTPTYLREFSPMSKKQHIHESTNDLVAADGVEGKNWNESIQEEKHMAIM